MFERNVGKSGEISFSKEVIHDNNIRVYIPKRTRTSPRVF